MGISSTGTSATLLGRHTNERRTVLRWSGGSAALVDQTGAFGAFSATPVDHYAQFALKTSGGRHVCGWNGRAVFDGDYREGLLSLTPAGHTLEGVCRADWRLALIISLSPNSTREIARSYDNAALDLAPSIDLSHPLVWQLAQSIATECETGAPNGTLFAETAATMLSLQLLRQQGALDGSIPKSARGGLPPRQLSRVTDYIDDRLGEDISLTELAGLVGLSRSHFCRAFKVSTGVSPHQWRTDRRIERAKKMLLDLRIPVAEIALSCGFSSQSHFGEIFHDRVGFSPAAWRRRQLT